MDTRERGNATEARVIARLVEEGVSVYTPFNDGERADLVVDLSDDLIRVQVKTGRMIDSGSKVCFNTSSTQTYYTEVKKPEPYHQDVDAFIVYTPDLDEYYFVGVDEAPDTAMELRVEEPDNVVPSINWEEDYLLDGVLPDT